MAAADPTGYGRFKIAGKAEMAHRIAYDLAIGGLDSDLMICHHCDNPPCCNPAHLFQGTRSDNMKDAYAKGRLPFNDEGYVRAKARGERIWSSKLAREDVMRIRTLASMGVRKATLGRLYGVDRTNVGQIVARRTWTHV